MQSIQNYVVLKNETSSNFSATDNMLRMLEERPKPAPKESFWSLKINFNGKVKPSDIVLFSQQFAGMISTGITVRECLDILIEQTENKALKNALIAIREDINRGESLSSAFLKHSAVFPTYFPYLIKAGEEGGILNLVLEKQAQFMEKSYDFGQKIRAMFIYPTIVLILACAVITFLLIKVFPNFAEFYSGMNQSLPFPTRILMFASGFMTSNLSLFFILLSAAIGVSFLFLRSKYFSGFIEKFAFNMPLFGRLARAQAVSRFIRVFGLLFSSGVPVVTALDVAEDISGNIVMRKIIREMKESLSNGKNLSAPLLNQKKIFPAFVIHAIAVGERGGTLSEILEKTADFVDSQLNYEIKKVTMRLEPLITIFMGGFVAFIVGSMYLPLFSILSSITK